MRVQLKEVQLFRKLFDLIFASRFSSEIVGPPCSGISTAFHPTSAGTLLIAEKSGRSLSRVISARPCTESFACSCHWLDEFHGDEGYIDVSTRRNFVEFSSMNGNESRVLSLLAVSPSTSWASPMMGAVDEQFIATLIRETDRFKSNGCNYFGRSIQLDGKRGNITTTCGGETISYSGFQFPWGQTVSISVSDVFASLDLGKRDQVACGVLDRSFFISAGPWRLQLPLESGASAIDIEAEKKSLGRVSNHVHLDPKDLAFLLDHLKPFSQEVGSQQFVSLQLNDQVEVAIEAPMEEYDDSPPKRLILSRSTYKGKPTIIPIQSWHLRQSATLGITQLQWHGAAKRLSGTKDRLTYICESSLHLDDDLSLPADAVEIDSAAGSPLPA